MKTGTSRASARRKSVRIGSISGSGVQSGSEDSTRVAPNRAPSMALISAAAAVTIGCSVFEPGGITIDSRMMPRRSPASAPGAPREVAWAA